MHNFEKTVSSIAIKDTKEWSIEKAYDVDRFYSNNRKEVSESTLLEDHIFCALLGYFAAFDTPQDIGVQEKPKPKFVDCSADDPVLVNITKSKIDKEQSFDSTQVLEVKKSIELKVISRGSVKTSSKIVQSSKRRSRPSKTARSLKPSETFEKIPLPTVEVEESKPEIEQPPVEDNNAQTNVDNIYDVTGKDRNLMQFLMEGLTFDFLNGNSYKGNIGFNGKEGNGMYCWFDGSVYKGKFNRDLPNGEGCMEWADESRYEGYFYDGLRSGSGSYVLRLSVINQTYSGSWSEGLQSGKGTLKFSEKNWYDGEFKFGLYHGQGLRQYSSGGKYLGSWKKGKQNGHGIMLFPNNDMYIGDWTNGTMNGTGKYIWDTFLNTQFVYPMHNAYFGHWKNGTKNGFGSLILSSGAVISTIWANNIKHGWGRLLCTNGATIESNPLFVNNILVSMRDALYRDEYLLESDAENYHDKRNHLDNIKKPSPWNLKSADCIFEPYKSCFSPVNLPPYFMNLDSHLNKFFQLDDWNKRIQSRDWCAWSLNMPPLCERDKLFSDSEKIDEDLNQPLNANGFEVKNEKFNTNEKINTERFVMKSEQQESSSKNHLKSASKAELIETCIKYSDNKKKKVYTKKSLTKSDYNINKAEKWTLQLSKTQKVSQPTQQINDVLHKIYSFEKKWLRNTIIKHMPTLQKLYNRYATLCCKEKPTFETGLLRILLWKLLKDVNFNKSGYSIVEIDEMAGGKMDPFDFVSVSEMIHYLLIVAWELNTKQNNVNKAIPGIIAGGFDLFILEEIYPIINKEESYEPLFPNSETIPVEALYKLYLSLGPGITIKKLVQILTRKADAYFFDKRQISLLPQPDEFFKHTLKGQNGILPGGQIIYKASKLPDFEYLEEELRKPPDSVKYVNLEFLGTLGVDTLIATVVKCFPYLINNRGEILQQNYQICFLEFLDILNECLDIYLVRMTKFTSDMFHETRIEMLDKCMDQLLKEIGIEPDSTVQKQTCCK